MAQEMAALTLLGESADWLKDSEGRSIRDHRLSVLDAYRQTWSDPAETGRFAELDKAMVGLFKALAHNNLYPDGLILSRTTDPVVRYLSTPATMRKDIEHLRNFCVVNKFGIGEIHLLYFTLLLCRTLYLPEESPYDELVEKAVGDVLLLRAPIYRADNLGAFSEEARARFHAVRLMRSMTKIGLFSDGPIPQISVQDQAETRELLANGVSVIAARYIQKPHRLAFKILHTATALEEFVRAHAAGRAPEYERNPAELFLRLRHLLKQVPESDSLGQARKTRLTNLGIAALVRATAHVEASLGREMYAFLRSARRKPRIRHARMMELLPNNTERLRFLNFLYLQGKQNPVYYIDRFGRYFSGERLRFINKDVGFGFESSQPAQ